MFRFANHLVHSFTARELNFSRPAVWLVTLMILCENSYTTISRTLYLAYLSFFLFLNAQ